MATRYRDPDRWGKSVQSVLTTVDIAIAAVSALAYSLYGGLRAVTLILALFLHGMVVATGASRDDRIV